MVGWGRRPVHFKDIKQHPWSLTPGCQEQALPPPPCCKSQKGLQTSQLSPGAGPTSPPVENHCSGQRVGGAYSRGGWEGLPCTGVFAWSGIRSSQLNTWGKADSEEEVIPRRGREQGGLGRDEERRAGEDKGDSVRHASLQAVVSGLGFFLSATESHQRVINMLVM